MQQRNLRNEREKKWSKELHQKNNNKQASKERQQLNKQLSYDGAHPRLQISFLDLDQTFFVQK